MTDGPEHSEILTATATRLYELAYNLASSNLAEQPDDSLTLSFVRRALETGRAVGHHLASLAVELDAPDTSTMAELASDIEIAGRPHTLNLTEEDIDGIYDARPDSEEDCIQSTHSDGYSGHFLCELTIDETTFPCLGCPLVVRRFVDLHHRPELTHRTPAPGIAEAPRNPGPPARRMMMDLADAVNALSEIDLAGLPPDSVGRRRLAYVAIALAQLADYGVNIYYFALMEMAQLDSSSAWEESQTQANRAGDIDKTLYRLIAGRPFIEAQSPRSRGRCERAFQARDDTERFYCAHIETIPDHLQEDESVAEMCQRCPFRENPPHPSLLALVAA